MNTWINVVALAIAGSLMVAGCNRDSKSGLQSATQPSSAPTTQSAPFEISEVRFVVDEANPDKFLPQPLDRPVRVRVTSKGTGKGETLGAKLINIGDGSVIEQQSYKFSKNDEVVTLAFKPLSTQWAPGRYLLEVTLNDALVSHHDLDISAPPAAAAK